MDGGGGCASPCVVVSRRHAAIVYVKELLGGVVGGSGRQSVPESGNWIRRHHSVLFSLTHHSLLPRRLSHGYCMCVCLSRPSVREREFFFFLPLLLPLASTRDGGEKKAPDDICRYGVE